MDTLNSIIGLIKDMIDNDTIIIVSLFVVMILNPSYVEVVAAGFIGYEAGAAWSPDHVLEFVERGDPAGDLYLAVDDQGRGHHNAKRGDFWDFSDLLQLIFQLEFLRGLFRQLREIPA